MLCRPRGHQTARGKWPMVQRGKGREKIPQAEGLAKTLVRPARLQELSRVAKWNPHAGEESQRMRDLFLENRQSGGLLKLRGMKPMLGMLPRDVLMAH